MSPDRKKCPRTEKSVPGHKKVSPDTKKCLRTEKSVPRHFFPPFVNPALISGGKKCLGTLFYVRGHFFMSGDTFLCPGTLFYVWGHFLCPGTLFYVRGHFFMSGDIFLCPGTFFCVSGHFFVSRDTFSCSGGSNFLSQKSPKPIGNGIVLCPVTFFGCAQRVFPGQRRKAPELLATGWFCVRRHALGAPNAFSPDNAGRRLNCLDVIAGSVAVVGAKPTPL